MPHLAVAITAHGYGHAAQVAPVVDELWRRHPALRITLATEVPEAFLRARIRAPFAYVAHAADFGLCMQSAFDIDLRASFERYRALHDRWEAELDRERRFLDTLAPDCLLADVPYLSLAAARRAGVPAIALCSLNWADVFAHYLGREAGAAGYLDTMRAAYGDADLFIRPTPSMPMSWLDNSAEIGVIARTGRRQRDALCAQLGVGVTEPILIAAPGGIRTHLAVERWPGFDDSVWLVPDDWPIAGPRMFRIGTLSMSFTDALASVDCILGKCGYGTVAECVVNGTPLAYVPRPDWPEEPGLVDWLDRHDAGVAVDVAALAGGGLRELLQTCARRAVRRVEPHGIAEAAELIGARLGLGAARPGAA